jgi:NAD(P)-dependent dehydrogenase (short-subunit alcohol dehydrogenase family)
MVVSTGHKVAVVTGGTAGVGRATVRELAGRGYDVAILARGAAGLQGAAADVRKAGRQALPVPADVADYEAVRQAAAQTESELGEIDVWVNVAFAGSLAFAWDTSIEEFRRMTEVTYYGQVHGTLAALERMRPRDRGVIINVGSAMAYRSIPLQATYCGAKHAVKGFTESVMCELAHEKSKVRLCMVQLPGLNTPQFNWNLSKMPAHPMPVPPVFQPELPARAIAYLAEHPRRNMWVGVSTAYTILGERLAPKLLDWYLGRTGVKSQQTDQDLPRLGPNVFEPRDQAEDQGAHGAFDDKAHAADPLLWLSERRRAALTAVALAGVAAGAVASRRSLRVRLRRRGTQLLSGRHDEADGDPVWLPTARIPVRAVSCEPDELLVRATTSMACNRSERHGSLSLGSSRLAGAAGYGGEGNMAAASAVERARVNWPCSPATRSRCTRCPGSPASTIMPSGRALTCCWAMMSAASPDESHPVRPARSRTRHKPGADPASLLTAWVSWPAELRSRLPLTDSTV